MKKQLILNLTLITLAEVAIAQSAGEIKIAKDTVETAGKTTNSMVATKDTVGKKATAYKELKDVVVAAEKAFIVQTADKIILNVTQSPTAAGGNAYDAISKAPGVFAGQDGNLLVRGKSINVYIDGRPSNLTNAELQQMLTSMSAASIEKIEIMVNPPARYDAQGGAIINIKTIRDKNLGTNGVLTLGGGTGRFARYNGGISLNHRTKKVNIYAGYDYMHNQQYYDNNTVRYIDPDISITEKEYDRRTRDNHAYRIGTDYDMNKRTSVGILVKGYTNYRDLSIQNTSVLSRSKVDTTSTVATNGYARFFSPALNA